jgi:two-component system, chemotaxis family, protein-glutamate methylesterase/glutaminase
MANRDIVAIGTSAGGVAALLYLVKQFPSDFPAAVLITIHVPSDFRSGLDEVLTRAGPLPASFGSDGDPLKPGRIYLAPPDRHLIAEGDQLALGTGPPENWARPAIDPMLRSVAVCCGPRAIGLVLTGTLCDGASGLHSISHCGGIAVVQDPTEAAFAEMPLRALNQGDPHYVVSLSEIPSLLANLVHQPAGDPMPIPERLKFEVKVARGAGSSIEELEQIGRRSVLSCPQCGGVMWEIEDGDLLRYRCHVGHALSSEAMSTGISDKVREALYVALRALDEQAALADKLHERASDQGRNLTADRWIQRKEEADRQREVIQTAINHADEIVFQSIAPNKENG